MNITALRLFNITDFSAIDEEEFDFIIVGAGPAGSVLTHRLSEHRESKILLLEAGEEPSVLTDIPKIVGVFSVNKKQDWDYKYEKNPHFGWGMNNGRLLFPRGKGLGGTTITNFMIFSRGTKADFEEISKLGNDEWSWDNIEPIFKSLENLRINVNNSDERGHTGLLFCDRFENITPSGLAFVDACNENGMKKIDYNANTPLGTSIIQNLLLNGLRLSSEKAFLRPIKKRPNLKILTRSLVEKVLINSDQKATGVVYTRDGIKYTAKAKKEVILSAGVINTPQILMLSGIGPAEQLKKHGITVIKSLPVGRNLKDHLAFFGNKSNFTLVVSIHISFYAYLIIH